MIKGKIVKNIMLASIIGGSSLGIIPLQTNAAQETEGIKQLPQATSYSDHAEQLGMNKQAPTTMKWNMTVISDSLGITQKMNYVLQNTVFQNITRELTDATFSIANNGYNVVMFTSHSNYEYHFQGIKFQATINFEGNQYDLYIFENGKFRKDNPRSDKPWAWAYKGWAINPSATTPYIQFYLP
ncbi:TPA: hypothetical protein ROY17_004801 [Bacillus thuringiensis]|nr:hypothetical protein [Bacillus thuringiensis]